MLDKKLTVSENEKVRQKFFDHIRKHYDSGFYPELIEKITETDSFSDLLKFLNGLDNNPDKYYIFRDLFVVIKELKFKNNYLPISLLSFIKS